MKRFSWFNVLWVLFSIFFLFLAFFLTILLDGFLISLELNPIGVLGTLFFWFIFVFFIYITLFKTYNDIKQHKNGLNPFKKYNKVNEFELFINDIEKLPTYKKIIKGNDGFILIDEAGIFEVRFIYCNGILKGNINDEKWHNKKKEIDNPFILKGNNIIRYLVLTRNMVAQVTDIRLVTKYSLTFTLERHLNKRIFTKEQIDKEYELYGGNQN